MLFLLYFLPLAEVIVEVEVELHPQGQHLLQILLLLRHCLLPLTMKIARQEPTFLLLRRPLALLGRQGKTPILMSLRCLNWVEALRPNQGFQEVQLPLHFNADTNIHGK